MNASGRPNTCKSNGNRSFGMLTSGARVRNAYVTYPLQGDSPGKLGLIPHSIIRWHLKMIKDLLVMDGHASD
jgi:hypothetical protein